MTSTSINTVLLDINDSGEIIGGTSGGSPSGAFIDSDGAITALVFPDAPAGGPTAINDSGQIVGLYTNSTGTHGFVDTGGSFTTIDEPEATVTAPSGTPTTATEATGINNSGEVVGTFLVASDPIPDEPGFFGVANWDSFLYADGSFTTITVPSPEGVSPIQTTWATGINNSGDIVGYYQDATGTFYGFLDAGGTFTNITDTLAVTGSLGSGTLASAINEDGVIAGRYEDSAGVEHGFVDDDGAFTTIDAPGAAATLPSGDAAGGAGTYVTSINASGVLVGYYLDSSNLEHGFEATPDASTASGYDFTTIDAPAVLPASPPSPPPASPPPPPPPPPVVEPTISGTVADQRATDLAPVNPFANVTISDQVSPFEEVTVAVTMSNPADGTFSDPHGGSYDAATGTYTATVNQAGYTPINYLDVDLNSLEFTPAAGLVPVGETVTTGFTVTATDTAGGSATDDTTSVIANTASLIVLANSDVTNNALVGSDLYMDSAGDLFGLTDDGGSNGDVPPYDGYGTIFELPDTSTGYASTPVTLANFTGAGDGLGAYGDLIADKAGDLFGTASGGGADGLGTVFELVNTGSGYATTPAALISFNGTDGAQPFAGLIMDAAGDLFGTTYNGGQGFTGGDTGDGTVFEIVNTSSGYASTPITLVTFSGGEDGQNPYGGLVTDAAGDLFGTTADTVFEIVHTSTGYASTPTNLVTLASASLSTLIIDAARDLFGTTAQGGASIPFEGGTGGTVFEIANTSTGYATSPTILADFNLTDGQEPWSGLIEDQAGDLFGTTLMGGPDAAQGTVFEIAKTSTGYASTPSDLADFNGTTSGGYPYLDLIADSAGDLFGATEVGGSFSDGTLFELTGAGFVTCFRSGTRIATPSGEREIESLATGCLVLTASGEARPIVWIGRRRVDCRRHPAPDQVWPVRVRAGAFQDAVPHRDLFLSPNHAVFVDGVLIPIRHLINGASIAQVPVGEVTYYHIELDDHDVLLAEGLAAESYLDTGGRCPFFDRGGPVSLFPDFAMRSPDPAGVWETLACGPLIITGAALDTVRLRLNTRPAAIDRGYSLLPAVRRRTSG